MTNHENQKVDNITLTNFTIRCMISYNIYFCVYTYQ